MRAAPWHLVHKLFPLCGRISLATHNHQQFFPTTSWVGSPIKEWPPTITSMPARGYRARTEKESITVKIESTQVNVKSTASTLSSREWIVLRDDGDQKAVDTLNLPVTLKSGQAFRWQLQEDGSWIGVLRRYLLRIFQDGDKIKATVLGHMDSESSARDEVRYDAGDSSSERRTSPEATLKDYFQLDYCLHDLYKHWCDGRGWTEDISKCDGMKNDSINSATHDSLTSVPPELTPRQDAATYVDVNESFSSASSRLQGLRLLRQDPVECLFSFICSQNNNIARISGMIDKICRELGEPIVALDKTTHYTFPSLQKLASTTEEKLRDLGFGYRAKYIATSAQIVLDRGGEAWLASLRDQPRDTVLKELTALPGVGLKVAECVALFSLDKLDVVPVDTHVWKIARRCMPTLEDRKTVTPLVHKEVGDFFRARFGPLAGWAHSILFAAELKEFQNVKEKGVLASKKTSQGGRKRKRDDEKPAEDVKKVKKVMKMKKNIIKVTKVTKVKRKRKGES